MTPVLPLLFIRCEDATSLPRYITTLCNSLKNLYTQNDEENPEPHAKLFDFGSGECSIKKDTILLTPGHGSIVRRDGDATKKLQCMVLSHSPEILYAREVENVNNPLVERPSDAWALGTLVSSALPALAVWAV